jgi:two-component system nitrate/nitrite response regulator NarL
MEPPGPSVSNEREGAPDLGDLRVLVVADDPLARAGLAVLLSEQPDCMVVGQVSGQGDLPAQAAVYRPDVVLWDLGWERTPDLVASLEQMGELAEDGLPVVALLPDEAQAPEARASGVRGLLLRDASAETLQAALQAARQGLVVLDPSLALSPFPVIEPGLEFLVEELTPRETEVLQLLADGLTNKAIAQRLGISDHTVKFHVNAILGKLGAQSRTEAVVRATRLGLLLL